MEKLRFIAVCLVVSLSCTMVGSAYPKDNNYAKAEDLEATIACDDTVLSWYSSASSNMIETYNNTDNQIESRSWIDEFGVITTENYDAEGNVISTDETYVYDILQPLSETEKQKLEQVDSSTSGSPVSTRGIIGAPVTDDGLSDSPLFPGFKYIGSITDDGHTAHLHRIIDSETHDVDFRIVVADTTVAQLALALGYAYFGLYQDAALQLAYWIYDTVADSGEFGYTTYHYTYKVSIDDEKYYQDRRCCSEEYWTIHTNNEYYPGDFKGSTKNHNNYSMSTIMPMVIQDYINGGKPVSVVCPKAHS